jgi:hypothetical protein
MSVAIERRVPGFWQLQFSGWVLLYLLCLAAAAPHLHESFILAYNTWDIVILSAATLALRPMLRLASQRWRTSWLKLQGSIFCLCFLTGSIATYLISLVTFGYRDFRLSYWTLSGVQCSLVLFLWAVLYLGVRQWNALQASPIIEHTSVSTEAVTQREIDEPVLATTFAVRTGDRLEIVPVDTVLWIAATGDYMELHTKSSIHLLRDTMTSLAQRLDRTQFIRIHRSRIVRIDQIHKLILIENGEYRVELHDGSKHRSSRTYANTLTEWMRLGTGELATSQRRQSLPQFQAVRKS